MLLENESIRVEFDGARMISFKNKAVGHELIEAPVDDPFLMILESDRCKENIVFGREQSFTAHIYGNTISLRTDRLKLDNGRDDAGYADISLTLRATLDGESLSFTADIENRTDLRITDFEYPRLGRISSLGDGAPTLFWSGQPGFLYCNVGKRLSSQHRSRENGANSMRGIYPGGVMLGTYALLDRTSSLFVSVNDPDFITCEEKVIGEPEDNGALILTVDKFLCLARGSMTTAPIKVTLYRGDWHRGADEYAAFMKDHRPTHEKPDWIKEMLGYFLVINKQQFGYEMWDYTTLPKLYELAKAHGCDTVGLFGWYDSGHDNNYPDLEVSDSMGGADELRRGIKAIQSAGGHVTLYYQGHLIDPCSDFASTEVGELVTAKNVWGKNYLDFYSKSHKSDFLYSFSRKSFYIGCPGSREWRGLMLERAKWLNSFDPDGWLYDQIGGWLPYVCFDERHGHDGGNPARAFPGGRMKLLNALQTGAKAFGRDKAFMSEHLTDLFSTYLDAVHGIGNMPGGRGDRSFEIGGETVAATVFPDFFRYCFPEVIVTLRNPNPFIEKRAVNYAFVFGFPIELELRYRADREDILADSFAEKREWAAKVAALRRAYKTELAHGRYVDDRGITCADPLIFAKGFETPDGRLAVTLWNDSDSPKLPSLEVEGRRLVSFETLDGRFDQLDLLSPNSVAVAIFE